MRCTNAFAPSQEKNQNKYKWTALREAFSKSDHAIIEQFLRNDIRFNYTAARVIAKNAGLTTRTVQSRLRELEIGGVILNKGTYKGIAKHRAPIVWKINFRMLEFMTGHCFRPKKTKNLIRNCFVTDSHKSSPRKEHLPLIGGEKKNSAGPPNKKTTDHITPDLPAEMQCQTFTKYQDEELDQAFWESEPVRRPERPANKKAAPRQPRKAKPPKRALTVCEDPKVDYNDRRFDGNFRDPRFRILKPEITEFVYKRFNYRPGGDELERWLTEFTPNELLRILMNLSRASLDHNERPHGALKSQLLRCGGEWKGLFNSLLKYKKV